MEGMGDNTTNQAGVSRPLTTTATILGKKWHPVIVAELLEAGPLGFNDLKGRVTGISDKVLSESLDDLEERGLVERTVLDDKPVRVEYSLTDRGEQLEVVITVMEEWGERYLAARDE